MTYLIDCSSCIAPPEHCADCVVSALLGPKQAELRITEAERDALSVLADCDLLPPLRLVATHKNSSTRQLAG